MKYFYVYASTTLPVFSDGTIDCDYANDNITKYFVDECYEDGLVFNIREYDIDNFKDIEKDHPAGEWENYNW